MRPYGQYTVQWSQFRAFRAGCERLLGVQVTDFKWWSQQDSNLRPLACEANSYRDYSLNLSKTPNNFKAYQSACLKVSSRSLHQYTDRRRYSESGKRCRYRQFPSLVRLPIMQRVPSNYLTGKPYFPPVRVLSESLAKTSKEVGQDESTGRRPFYRSGKV